MMKLRQFVRLFALSFTREWKKQSLYMYGRQELRKRGFCEGRTNKSRAVVLPECALEEFPLYYFVTLFR